jgi:hypothetical protein
LSSTMRLPRDNGSWIFFAASLGLPPFTRQRTGVRPRSASDRLHLA